MIPNGAFSEKTMKTIVMTRRVTVAIVVIAAIATLASASILANYIVENNSVRITAAPGLTAFESDGVTTITSIAWGDLQESQSQTHQVILRNTGGSQTLYILDNPRNTGTGQVFSVESLNPSQLPSGVSLTWNGASVFNG